MTESVGTPSEGILIRSPTKSSVPVPKVSQSPFCTPIRGPNCVPFDSKKVEMLFAHLKRTLKLDRLRLREPNDARDEFHLAATAQNLRKLAKLIPMPQATPI